MRELVSNNRYHRLPGLRFVRYRGDAKKHFIDEIKQN